MSLEQSRPPPHPRLFFYFRERRYIAWGSIEGERTRRKRRRRLRISHSPSVARYRRKLTNNLSAEEQNAKLYSPNSVKLLDPFPFEAGLLFFVHASCSDH